MRNHVRNLLPILILAVIGVGISIGIEIVHQGLSSDINYTSFCNVNSAVNCDVVLASRYASLFGIPMSRWAIAFYLAVLGITATAAIGDRIRGRELLFNLIFLAALWGLLFSIYMAVIAFVVLRTICLMCTGLYLVNIGLFVFAWRARGSLRQLGRRQLDERARRDRFVAGLGIVAAVAIVAVVAWEATGRGEKTLTAAAVEQQHPDFYRWYYAQPVTAVSDDADHARGSQHAAVTIVEFSDFACGHCAAFHQSLEDVLRRSGANVRVVFRHFPLDSACNPGVPTRVHPDACLAAVAAECAGNQGKFWQYHNILFDNQQRLGREFLISYAQRLGLDTARFAACLGGDEARQRVERDATEGTKLGIDSTPTLFINGRMIKGALESDRLSDALILASAHH